MMPTTPRFACPVTLPLVLLSGLLAGCVPPKGNLGEYTASEASSGETDTSGSDGTTSIGTGTETDGVPFDPACGEPAQPSWESAIFSFEPQLEGENFAGACEVSEVEPHPGHVNVGLLCGDQQVQIRLQFDEPVPPLFAAGDLLVLDYRANESFYTSEWYTIRRPGADATLVLAGMNADRLEPHDTVDFFAPLALAFHEGVCPTPMVCDDDPAEQIAIEFTHEGVATEVFAAHNAVLGDVYRVSVGVARKFHAELPDGQGGFCSVFDVPPYFYRAMVREYSQD